MNDLPVIAIVVAALSLSVSAFSLGWNIYRDIVLKGRLKVSCHISTILHGSMPTFKAISISGVNHGPGKIKCTHIVWTKGGLLAGLLGKATIGTVIEDSTNRYSSKLPKDLDVGERVDLLLPHVKDSVLSIKPNRIGISDSFGRKHWAPRWQVRAAHKGYLEERDSLKSFQELSGK